MLYEVQDPGAYVVPDVVCDWRHVTMAEEAASYFDAKNRACKRVCIKGAKASQVPSAYKVCCIAIDKKLFSLQFPLLIVGHDAAKKARKTAEALKCRTEQMFNVMGTGPYPEWHVEILGDNHFFPIEQSQCTTGPLEVVLKIGAKHDMRSLGLLLMEVGSSAVSMAPGTAGSIGGGRPRPTPVMRMQSFLLEKSKGPKPRVEVDGIELLDDPTNITFAGTTRRNRNYTSPIKRVIATKSSTTDHEGASGYHGSSTSRSGVLINPVLPASSASRKCSTLLTWCTGRSGDKGDVANIGIICRDPRDYGHLLRCVTADRVKAYFGNVCGIVSRFEVPGIAAVNFLLEDANGGGGLSSLRSDPLAKTYAQRLLRMKTESPPTSKL
ncbi:unnamed protein product [Amoebophrya sp. A25]|nr:unnamed protein product [Amoebophrya sp. A25]|eukprot:GSA25T00025815001.1